MALCQSRKRDHNTQSGFVMEQVLIVLISRISGLNIWMLDFGRLIANFKKVNY